jgi:long-chain acyl-CoA synthetase
VEVKQAMLAWWGPVLYESYGGTESGTTCSIGPEEWSAHPGSVGRAVPPFVALVVDDDGTPLPANTEGRLYFRDTTGRGIRYEGDPQKTAEAHLEPGVFTLGEIGRIDDDGFVYITDRFNDMVVSGGVNIYPAEAEQALQQHPAVADIACIGLPDAEMGWWPWCNSSPVRPRRATS